MITENKINIFLDDYFDMPLEANQRKSIINKMANLDYSEVDDHRVASSLILAYFFKKANFNKHKFNKFFDSLIKDKSLIMVNLFIDWNNELHGLALLNHPEVFMDKTLTFGQIQKQVSEVSLMFHSTFYQALTSPPDTEWLLDFKNQIDQQLNKEEPAFYKELVHQNKLYGITIGF